MNKDGEDKQSTQQQDTQEAQNTNPSRLSKNFKITIIIIIAILIAAITTYLLFSLKNQNTPIDTAASLPQEEIIVPTIAEINEVNDFMLAYSKGVGEVWIYNYGSKEARQILPELDRKKFCGEACAERNLSISPDGKSIVVDRIVSGEETGFGYIDLDDPLKTIHYVYQGELPIWSKDKNIIFFRNYEGSDYQLSMININTKEVTRIGEYTFEDNGPTDSEVILSNFYHFGIYYIYNFLNNSIKTVTVKELASSSQRIMEIVVSPNRDTVILYVTKGKGYDVGIAPIDGSNYKSVSGFSNNVSTGSGYYGGQWSPNQSQIVLNDWFHSESYEDKASRALKIVNISGKQVVKIDAKTTADINICWYQFPSGQNIIYSSSDELSSSSVNIVEMNTKKIETLLPEVDRFSCFP